MLPMPLATKRALFAIKRGHTWASHREYPPGRLWPMHSPKVAGGRGTVLSPLSFCNNNPAPPRCSATCLVSLPSQQQPGSWPSSWHLSPHPTLRSLYGYRGHPPALLCVFLCFHLKMFPSSSLGGKHTQVKGWLASHLSPTCSLHPGRTPKHPAPRGPCVPRQAAAFPSYPQTAHTCSEQTSFLTTLYSAFSFAQHFSSVCLCVSQLLPTLKTNHLECLCLHHCATQ